MILLHFELHQTHQSHFHGIKACSQWIYVSLVYDLTWLHCTLQSKQQKNTDLRLIIENNFTHIILSTTIQAKKQLHCFNKIVHISTTKRWFSSFNLCQKDVSLGILFNRTHVYQNAVSKKCDELIILTFNL